jgi:hypothetical protein
LVASPATVVTRGNSKVGFSKSRAVTSEDRSAAAGHNPKQVGDPCLFRFALPVFFGVNHVRTSRFWFLERTSR